MHRFGGGRMDDVRKWLSELRLDHLASIFAKNQIDFESLRLLSEEDLQEMRILSARAKDPGRYQTAEQ